MESRQDKKRINVIDSPGLVPKEELFSRLLQYMDASMELLMQLDPRPRMTDGKFDGFVDQRTQDFFAGFVLGVRDERSRMKGACPRCGRQHHTQPENST